MSEGRLEKAIDKKKKEISRKLIKKIDQYHYSWYSGDNTPEFDGYMEIWAESVRGIFFHFNCHIIYGLYKLFIHNIICSDVL
jgi:hypothetical protein